jgi:hypothetical protein
MLGCRAAMLAVDYVRRKDVTANQHTQGPGLRGPDIRLVDSIVRYKRVHTGFGRDDFQFVFARADAGLNAPITLLKLDA